jgi:hypothetical protein
MAVISRGIELYCKSILGNKLSTSTFDDTLGNLLPGLQEIGELNGLAASSEREKIEITTLADDKHVYAEGILTESENETIDFTFLYEPKLFAFLKLEAKDMADNTTGEKDTWTIVIPTPTELSERGTTKFTMQADVVGLKVNGTGVNSALTMSLTLKPVDAITITTAA